MSSVSTDDLIALVWVGKSLLAELTSDVASLLIVVTCDFSALTSPLVAALVSPLTELSRLLRSEQYDGLLLPPQPATASSATAATNATGRRIQARPARFRDVCRLVLFTTLGGAIAAASSDWKPAPTPTGSGGRASEVDAM